MGLKKPLFFANIGLILWTGFAEPVAKLLSPSAKLASPLSLPAPRGQAGPFFFTRK